MESEFYAGIDVGREGAFALIHPDGGAQVWDMPESIHRGVDLREVQAIMATFPAGVKIALEYNTARPGEVPDFAFRFGLQTGQIEAIAYMQGRIIGRVPSATWTAKLGVTGKSHDPNCKARAHWMDIRYPEYSGMFRGPRGGILDGRLDALLIALYSKSVGGMFGKFTGRKPPRHFGLQHD